jgi:hypothetical protein
MRFRTDRGRSPRRLVPWWARVLRRVGMRWEMCRLRRGSLSIRSSRPRFTGLQSSSRRSVVKALFSRNRMKGAWGSHARYLCRPGYRVTSGGTQAQVLQVKPASLTFFWIQCWLSTGVTEPAARTFGEAPQLGRILLGLLRKRREEAARLGSHTAPRPLQLLDDRDWRFAYCHRTLAVVEAAKFDPRLSPGYS